MWQSRWLICVWGKSQCVFQLTKRVMTESGARRAGRCGPGGGGGGRAVAAGEWAARGEARRESLW